MVDTDRVIARDDDGGGEGENVDEAEARPKIGSGVDGVPKPCSETDLVDGLLNADEAVDGTVVRVMTGECSGSSYDSNLIISILMIDGRGDGRYSSSPCSLRNIRSMYSICLREHTECCS